MRKRVPNPALIGPLPWCGLAAFQRDPMRPEAMLQPWKVVRTDAELRMPRVDAQLRAAGVRLVQLPDGVTEDRLVREVADADLLLMCYSRITAQVINQATRLKAIIKYGVGIDAIDIVAARERGIPVTNVPRYAEETVAEGAFFLLMALAKRMKPLQRAMQDTGWVWPEPTWLGHDLAGKTLGLIGLGHIGRSVARMAAAFRLRVLAYDPRWAHVPTDLAVQRCDELGQMLAQSDFVSVHCVLNEQTRHLIAARQLEQMKPGAFLVNVSRGEIVDEAALVAALQAGRIAGAAMDNVLLWPHLTFYTHEAMQRLEDETLARCFEALEGRPLSVHSNDPRLRAQRTGVRFVDDPAAG
jgi:D-3-phosphoglycerate dehydrogenase / 2-oxoglutarate reductase